MRYSEDLIEEVRSRNDIVDVVSGYVKLTRKGSNYFGLCPFHNEKSPSFSVSRGKQMYYCFGCGAGGNVFTFLMEYENYSFQEALKELAERAGIELPDQEYSESEKRDADLKSQILEANKLAAKYYYYQLRTEGGHSAWKYLTDRKLSEETIRHFGLGYSTKYRDDLYQYLKKQGFTDELLRQSGLITMDEKNGVYDKFWNRVMFPIMDAGSRVIGFGGRVMGDAKPKYLNSPETKAFDKSRNLYGMNFARTSRKPQLIICEGYMDVIALHQAGFNQAVASLGTALTTQQAMLMKRYTDKVLLTYDSDGAGVKAAMRAIPILKDAGISAKVINMRPYKDPDEFIKNLGAEEFEKRMEEAQNSFLYELAILERDYDLKDPEGKTNFQNEIAARLLQFSEEMERENYIEAVADQYHISYEGLKKRVNDLGNRGVTAPGLRREDSPSGADRKPAGKREKETGADVSQKLLLTWLIEVPALYGQLKDYLSPEDFTGDPYSTIAQMLFAQLEKGELNPARIISSFEDSEDQNKAASLFNARLKRLETKEEQEKAVSETLRKVKKYSLDERARQLDVTDMAGFQKLILERSNLQKLEKLHISID